MASVKNPNQGVDTMNPDAPNTTESPRPSKRQKISRSPSQVSGSSVRQAVTEESKMGDATPAMLALGARNSTTPSEGREVEVGIKHFVNTSNPGFNGILKMRYVISIFYSLPACWWPDLRDLPSSLLVQCGWCSRFCLYDAT